MREDRCSQVKREQALKSWRPGGHPTPPCRPFTCQAPVAGDKRESVEPLAFREQLKELLIMESASPPNVRQAECEKGFFQFGEASGRAEGPFRYQAAIKGGVREKMEEDCEHLAAPFTSKDKALLVGLSLKKNKKKSFDFSLWARTSAPD